MIRQKSLWLLGLVLCLPAALHAAETLAIVNGEAITDEDVDNAFRRTSLAQRVLTSEQTKLYRRHVLHMLIDDSLVAQYLTQRGLVANEAKVTEHIREIEKQLVESGKTLASFLAEMNITEERMRNDIRNIHRWIDFVESQAQGETLRKYFEANKAAFDGAEVRASHILVKVKPDATTPEREAARKKMEQIRAQLAAGTDFAAAARLHSDCPSKEAGGDLNYFPRKGVMSESFAAAAFSLPKGQISQVVETEFGYHLLLVTDRKSGKPVHFQEVVDEVKTVYADDLRAAVIAQMRKNADIRLK